jgi:hypothetical protein
MKMRKQIKMKMFIFTKEMHKLQTRSKIDPKLDPRFFKKIFLNHPFNVLAKYQLLIPKHSVISSLNNH